ncbi:MAG: DMT family transporter [Rhizobiales bacterium]|nr:DMT family transporter [Hyphomicrobiales bacterium]
MSAPAQGSELRGIALLCVALVFFSCLDTIAKYLSADLPVLQIVWVRFLTHAIFMVVIFRPRQAVQRLVSANLRLQLWRTVLLFATTVFNFLAVQELQLSVTVSIMFTAPLIIAALSVSLLGEVVGARRWAAIVVGFIGVLLVTKPGFGDFGWATIFSFAAAGCFALYALATRMVARFDSAVTTILYTPLAGVVVLAPVMPFVWVSPSEPVHWGLLLITGALGGYGHYLMVLAHRAASAALLAPFIYTQIVSMIILGLLVFGDIPVMTTLIGAAIVIASGLYLLYRTRKSES